MPYAVSRCLTLLTTIALLALAAIAMPNPIGAQPYSPPLPSVPPSPLLPEPWIEASPFAVQLLSPDQAPTLCPVEEGQDPYEMVDAYFQQVVDRVGFPGAAMAVARDGVVVFERGRCFASANQRDGDVGAVMRRRGSELGDGAERRSLGAFPAGYGGLSLLGDLGQGRFDGL